MASNILSLKIFDNNNTPKEKVLIEGNATSDDENDFMTDDDDDEENVDIAETISELKTLKRKFEKSVKENKKLRETVEELKTKLYEVTEKMSRRELTHKRELATTQKASDVKFDEREKLLCNLRIFIDRQEDQIHKLQEEQGEEVLFNVSNSLDDFVKQIRDLQDEIITLKEDKIKTKDTVDDLKAHIKNLETDVSTNYVPLIDYNCLAAEKEILMKARTPSKLFFKETLENEVESLQEERKIYKAKNKDLDDKNFNLKKQIWELESKVTTLTYAPPKVQIRKVVDESTEERLRTVEDEKFELEKKLRGKINEHRREVEQLNEKLTMCKNHKERLEERERSHLKESRECSDIIKDLRNRLEEERKTTEKLKEQIEKSSLNIERIQMDSEQKQQQLTVELKTNYDTLLAESRQKEATFNRLVQHFRQLSRELNEFKDCKERMSRDLKVLNDTMVASSAEAKEKIIQAVNETTYRANLLSTRYKKEIELRKKLHNEIVQLKGNIRVFCRVRPLIKEDGHDCSSIVSFDENDNTIMFVKNKSSNKSFCMDRVFQPSATQKEVFVDVKALVTSCLDGYNVCIFAYGQTGSGKTYTMEGTEKNPGINQQALNHLFVCADDMKDWKFTILVSFVEIYNETIRDLLNSQADVKLVIKQNNKDGLHIPGLTHVKVASVIDVNEVFSLGRCNRSTASTNMNERSSRSHSVLTITVIGENMNTKTQVTGKLNLVDLAGSERVNKSGSEGLRMKEAQSINKSLSALGDVIHALKNKSAHVPYRNTKLTYMLQDSLGGDSKTLMVVQISPVDKNVGETLCSLNFAQRVKEVELGAASKKVRKAK